MLNGLLPDWHRSSVFLSGASVTKLFDEQFRTCFLYLKTKGEIARLEIPFWLIKNKSLFDTTLSAVAGQVQKGMGYPVALAEAHHLAVIKGVDRQQFFDFLTRHLVSIGAGPVSVSPKEGKKRVGLV
jgi:NurA-like 5'-3' nuclease